MFWFMVDCKSINCIPRVFLAAGIYQLSTPHPLSLPFSLPPYLLFLPLSLPSFPYFHSLPSHTQDLDIPIKRGTFIEYRTGTLNISPIGRNCNTEERNAFEVRRREERGQEGQVEGGGTCGYTASARN